MKVVIPVMDLHIGGGCKVLADIADALASRGHDVEMVIPETGTVKYPISCKLTRVSILAKPNIPCGDIILTNYYTTFTPSYEAWPDQCVRLSLGFEPLWVRDRKQALWTYEQDVPTISISHWLARQIHKYAKRRSEVIPLGIDPLIYESTIGKRHDNNSEAKVILYIARDPKAGYKLKGFDDFRVCMGMVKYKLPIPFIVYLVCPERELTLPGIPHRIFRPDNEKDMADLYRSADIFVSSSWYEGFALPPLEAMACGTPVVTTNSGGVADFCTHMESAYMTPPRQPRLLARGICEVLTDSQLAAKLVQGGARSAALHSKERFTNEIADVLERIYKSR